MNSITTFFTVISTFISGLFGHHVMPTPPSPQISNVQLPIVVASSSDTITQKSTSTNPKLAIEVVDLQASSTFVYSNDKYGFTLRFPNSWKNYKMHEGAHERCMCTSNMWFGVDKAENALVVEVYTPEEWKVSEKNRKEITTEMPLYMGKTDKYIFMGWNRGYDYNEKIGSVSGTVLTSFRLFKK